MKRGSADHWSLFSEWRHSVSTASPTPPNSPGWARGPVRDDKILTPQEAKAFLSQPVAIEQKIDGANIVFSLSTEGSLRIQQRGNYLQAPYKGQFSGRQTWLALHGPDLEAFLQEPEHQGLILFGEWCAARHSVAYTHLPDPFLLFDVADPERQRFWRRNQRDATAHLLGLATVPLLQDNSHHTLKDLSSEIDQFLSRYPQWCKARAKLVRPDFTLAIEDHCRSRPIEWNGIDYSLTA